LLSADGRDMLKPFLKERGGTFSENQ
jgi:hypothetical protein